ncbi:hypothetical protein EJ06DRAFT_487694 [Trichodelitschia bisporula]|uniref:WHIM1 domain-containing protein n=1 Tax=Trichodelitschia bisporula TaxID=703511 RepID=A0A6G1I9K0_9PEZI|nr:hypothetical protein EJ06DRAFT_487694 [Trichodelitschia bisporula]
MPSFTSTLKRGDLTLSSCDSSPSTKLPPPSKRKRPASPPHEEVLADKDDIAFIVMFRSRFSEVFSTKLIQFGPQDIERGVAGQLPSPQVEALLCALLGLVLNRKKPVERGHYGRALEEAISVNKSQWPRAWGSANPINSNRSFNTMSAMERLTLLKALIMWSLHSSDAVSGLIRKSYKQSRHDDDLNQPLSVQPWGRDGDKRRYWLIEGRDDTPFRLYRESNPVLKNVTWRSVAGTIDELRAVVEKLNADGTQAARRLADRITNAIPRFEATEEKRKRREYRQARKAQFTRPEPGFSLYEGRTRGKRMKYTFSDEDEEDDLEEDDVVENKGTRRSARNSGKNSGTGTSAEPTGPTYTSSGRRTGLRGGSKDVSGPSSTAGISPAAEDPNHTDASNAPAPRNGRSTRTSGRVGKTEWAKGRKHIESYNSVDEMDDEEDATSSGGDWDGGDEDEPEEVVSDEDEDSSMGDSDFDTEPKSLIVKLPVGNGGLKANTDVSKQNDTIAVAAPKLSITNGTSVQAPADPAVKTRNGDFIVLKSPVEPASVKPEHALVLSPASQHKPVVAAFAPLAAQGSQ